MPRYFPIDVGVSFECVRSDLLRIDWKVNELTADFALPDDEAHAVRVRVEGTTIVRLLDEMPLSIESDPASEEGRVPNHFAYRVEGGPFAEAQSAAFKEIFGPVEHYQFVTGWGCMDVLTGAKPSFSIVDAPG